jgi:hypothetical protein
MKETQTTIDAIIQEVSTFDGVIIEFHRFGGQEFK